MTRIAGNASLAGANGKAKPEAEVVGKPQRRWFNAEYKLRILREADAFAETGVIDDEHRHSGIAYLTPADVHFVRAEEVLASTASRAPRRLRAPPGAVPCWSAEAASAAAGGVHQPAERRSVVGRAASQSSWCDRRICRWAHARQLASA